MKEATKEEARLQAMLEARERTSDLRLPPEPRLCEELGVSRSRLRTLLKRAEDEGRVWRHVGKGTFVGPRPPFRDGAEQDLAVSVGDLFDARALIEPQLAAQAALHASPHDIEVMEAVLAELAGSQSFLEWKRLDARLHRLIAQATHNTLLLLIFDTMRSPMRWGLEARLEEVFGHPPGPRASANAQHHDIVAAIAAHNPRKAEAVVSEHINSVRALLFGRH